MKHEELTLERLCNAYARQNGWAAWKNEKNGNKGIPDGSYLHPCGAFVMVEFKTPQGRIRPEQQIWAQKFPDTVKFVRSFDEFRQVLETQIKYNNFIREQVQKINGLKVKKIEAIKK